MIGLLTTGHGHFATGLRSSMELVTGPAEHIVFVDFEGSDSPETLRKKFDKAFDKLKQYDGILILCDLAGGTPYKVAVQCSVDLADRSIQVIGGISLPMLMDGAMEAEGYTSPLELADELMTCGKDSMTLFALDDSTEENSAEMPDGI